MNQEYIEPKGLHGYPSRGPTYALWESQKEKREIQNDYLKK